MILNPKLDLKLERVVDVPPELVWKAWTEPKHLMPWFCPRPWKTTECTIDLRPGGLFYTVMESPEGQRFPSDGCYLEVVPMRRLVWTSALGAGYRPIVKKAGEGKECDEFGMTAFLLLEPHGKRGTKYTAIVMHGDEASCQRHDAMGFQDGWGAALNQLVEYVKGLGG